MSTTISYKTNLGTTNKATKKAEKSLGQRFKEYLLAYAETVAPGYIIMNGGHYVPYIKSDEN